MANLAMDFIQGITHPFEQLGAIDIGNPVRELTAQATGNQQALQSAQQAQNQDTQPKQALSNIAQVGLDFAAPGIARGAESAVGLEGATAATTGGKIALGAAKGATAGTAIGGAQGVAQGAGEDNGNSLTMDFLQGAGEGAALGGTIGAGIPAIKGANQSVQNIATPRANLHDQQVLHDYSDYLVGANKPTGSELNNLISQAREVGQKHGIDLSANASVEDRINGANSILDQIGQQRTTALQTGAIGSNVLGDDAADDLAKSDDEKQIQKQLQESVGPIVAKDVAPSVAQTNDPNIVHNIVNNDVGRKVSPATPELTSLNQPLPSPADLQPVTSVSDVNTPQQVSGEGEQLESNLNAPPDFLKAPGEEPGQSQVGRLGVMSNMKDMLQSGSTTDEALNHYFEQVPNSTAQEAHQALDEVINSQGFDKSKLNSSLNGQYNNVEFPPVKEGDDSAARLNGTYAGEQVGKNGSQAIQALQGLNEHDLELTRYLKGHNPEDVISQADDKTAFRSAVNALKQYNDYTQAAGAKLGQDIPYRQDYGLRTPYAPPELPPGEPGAVNPENPSYTQQRQHNTHEEALANDEVPKNADALEDLRADVNQRAYDQTRLALANSFEQAHPGQVKMLNDTTPLPSGYQQLLIPGGDHIALPSDIASKINERAVATPATGVLGKYDSINAAGKNLELGGGLFHGFNTGGIFAGQQLVSGKAFTNPGSLGRVVSNLFSDKSMADYTDTLDKTPSGGVDNNHSVLDGAQASGLEIKNTSQDIGKPGDSGLAGKVANIPGLKQIHNAIFERQIPTMMLETFRQKTQGLDIFGNADDREQAIKIAKGINNEYGSINRTIQGLTPRQFQLASRGVLATSYQEGQLVTLKNALSKGGAEGQIAREAVFGKALLFGGLATLGGLAGGDFKDQTPKQVALAIMNKAINPSFNIAGYKVSTPATQISNVAKPVEESIASAKKGQGIAAGPEDFASSHLAFAPSKAEELGTNKNFEGDAVYGKDYFGRPISAGTTAENVASGILPIPLAQTAQTATGNQSLGASIANTVGFNARPQYDLNYAPIAGQTYVQELEAGNAPKAKIQAATQFFDLLGQGTKNKNKTITQAETALKAGNPQKAQQLVSSYNQQLLKALLPWEQNGGTQYLDTNMLQLLRTAELTYKKATENTSYVAKTNPTSIGAPIAAIASNQGAQ